MFESLPGFREFYPEACFRRNYLFATWHQIARRFGFEEYDGPVLESLELYVKKSGDEITEQLFTFTDKGGREVALRPEMTPTLARMIGSKANSMKRPIKWYAIAENFRYERPSRGRLRSHYQLNADIYGEEGTGAEVELLALLCALFKAFGLGPDAVSIRLSDRQLWIAFLQHWGVEADQCLSVLSVVDKMERNPEAVSQEALKTLLGEAALPLWEQIQRLVAVKCLKDLEQLFNEEKAGGNKVLFQRLDDWKNLLRDLEWHGADAYVKVDFGIVRGLAYYTGFVFEAFEATGEGRALAGGGRYDELTQKMGGPSMPAAGFGFGDVMIELVLESLGKMPAYKKPLDVYAVFSRGDRESAQMRGAISRLRESGLSVEYGLKEAGFGKQFREASQKGARLVLICGPDEAERSLFKVKVMESGEEREVEADQIVDHLGHLLEF